MASKKDATPSPQPPQPKHPQEDEEFLLCVRCGSATCSGCDLTSSAVKHTLFKRA